MTYICLCTTDQLKPHPLQSALQLNHKPILFSGKLYVQSHNLPTWKLQKYIGGSNAKLQQVPIGSLTSKLFDETKSVYTEEYFILDSVNKTNIPRAVDPAVRVIYRPAFCAYVYGFKGWMDGYEILPKYRTMAKDLIRKNVAQEIFYDDFFFYVNYPGFPYIPRYNEIWYIVKLDIVEQRREQQRYPGNN